MTREDLRLECLRLTIEAFKHRDPSLGDVVKAARAFTDFASGVERPRSIAAVGVTHDQVARAN